MKIIISKTKQIKSDDFNWIYQEKKNEIWSNKWFYPDIQSCYLDLLDYLTRISEKKTLKEAFDDSIEQLKDIRKGR